MGVDTANADLAEATTVPFGTIIYCTLDPTGTPLDRHFKIENAFASLDGNLSIKGNDAAARTITIGQDTTNPDIVNVDTDLGVGVADPTISTNWSTDAQTRMLAVGGDGAHATDAGTLELRGNRSSDGTLGQIIFVNNNNSSTTWNANGSKNVAVIYVTAEGSAASGGNINFWTKEENGPIASRMVVNSDGKVGVNTVLPSSLLDVRGGAGSAGVITVSTAETTVVDGDVLGQINFQAPDEASGTDAILVAASIYAEADANFDATTNTTDLVFATGQSETATEKMRLRAGGGLAMSEQANADTDAAGRGQFWVRSDTPNVPMFTNDTGEDRQLTNVEVQVVVFDFGTNTTIGDGKYYFHVGKKIGSANLASVHAEVITAGTTGTLDIQIHNVDNVLDMLSTKLTIDTGETGSDTAATPAVINATNDHVDENDVLRIDVDAVHTTPAQGLIVTMEFTPR